jgi:hypothetical protein
MLWAGVKPARFRVRPRPSSNSSDEASSTPPQVRQIEQWTDVVELGGGAQLHGGGPLALAEVRDGGGQCPGDGLDTQRVGVAGGLEGAV